jgi:menaquinone-dependent protoporphyrinogen oxidase
LSGVNSSEEILMKILVSVATKHGSTAQIAQRLAEVLQTGLPDGQVVLLPAADVDDVSTYDAVVLGSAVYFGRWLAEARRAAELIAAQPARPVWLFSSGPVDEPAEPQPALAELDHLIAATHAREHRTFAGRLDRHQLGLSERAVLKVMRKQDTDLRDWDAIAAWGTQISHLLSRPATAPGPVSTSA